MERASLLFRKGEGTSGEAYTGKHWIERFRSLRSSMGDEHRGVFLEKRSALLAKQPTIESFGPPDGWTMPAFVAHPYSTY